MGSGHEAGPCRPWAGVVGLALLLLLAPVPARGGPSPEAAWGHLLETPLRVSGDLLGAAGLVGGAAVGLAGDAIALVDATVVPPGPLDGWISGPVHRIAMAVSYVGTGGLEGLRAEDIERLPEDPATYLCAAPGRGRGATLLDGLGSLRLAVTDAAAGPLLVVLALVGGPEERVADWRDRARTRFLGPLRPSGGSPTHRSAR